MKTLNKGLLNSYATKLILFVVGLIVIVSVTFTLVNIQQNTSLLHDQIIQKGLSLNSALSGVASNNIGSNKFYTLQEGLLAIKNKNKDVFYAYLVDKNGTVYAHTEPNQVGTTIKDDWLTKANAANDALYKKDQVAGKTSYKISMPISFDLERWGTLVTAIDTRIADEAIAKNRLFSIGMSLVILLVAIFITVFIARAFVKPIQYLGQKVQVIASGDLTQEIHINRHDELGSLGNSMNQMVLSVRRLISEVMRSSQQVTATSELLSKNADDTSRVTQNVAVSASEVADRNIEQTDSVRGAVEIIAQLGRAIDQIAAGAQEQARSINDTSNVVASMASSIEDVASRAKNVSEAATRTAEKAAIGGQAVESSISGMVKIKDKVFETAARVRELGDYSNKIGEIIQVIDEIAEQTNLLALNAAIEAARAGEHGKGFAVVADEVRKLAERSSKATKEIAELISNIQKGTLRAVHAMDEGTKEVETGSELSLNAGKALKDIVENINAVNDFMQSISSSAQSLSENSSQVVQSISNIAAISQENTAATEEIAASNRIVVDSIETISTIAEQNATSAKQVSAATEELTASNEEMAASAKSLADLSEKLDKIVGKFKI